MSNHELEPSVDPYIPVKHMGIEVGFATLSPEELRIYDESRNWAEERMLWGSKVWGEVEIAPIKLPKENNNG